MKKILAVSVFSIGLLAASQVFAAAYSSAAKAAANGATPVTIGQGMPQGGQAEGSYISAMPNNMGYQITTGRPGSMMLAYGYSRQAAWWGLLIIITVALVWVNLLLLTAFLWRLLKKHNKNQ